MALPGSGIVNQGLQRIGKNASAVGGSGAVGSSQTTTLYFMTLAVDDAAGITGGHTNFQAADTTLRNAGSAGPTNVYAQLFDAFSTISAQTVSCTTTIPTGSGNFTIVRISIHELTAASVNATSASLDAGISGQSITKTSSFTLAITLAILYTDNS